jgi:acyl-CoA thioester hydrolase
MIKLIVNYTLFNGLSMTNAKDTEKHTTLNWQHPYPFIREWEINESHIDHYEHTNNLAYVAYLEQLAWEHSNQLGLNFTDYKNLDRAMVITKHELNYHLPSHIGDTLVCATWIVECDKKFRLKRQFQYINPITNKTIFSASTHFVCVSLTTGSPKRMPQAFLDVYGCVAVKT